MLKRGEYTVSQARAARRLNSSPAVLSMFLLIALSPSYSFATLLFDGQLGTLPTAQDWAFVTNPLSGALATQVASSSWTTLDTRARRSDSAGYAPLELPGDGTLDRTAGFTLSINMKLLAESHTSTNRAGFSVLVVTDDLKAIELGFWTNQIWAQADSPLFTHAESAAYTTTAGFVRYDLIVHGNQYELDAAGSKLLTGSLRNYSSFGIPYSLPNFIFLGDDTSSASAAVQIARVELVSVPEPASFSLVGIALGIGLLVGLPRLLKAPSAIR